MIQIDTLAGLRRQVALWRSQGERIAFVPTMGNLHAGHLHLVERARELADRVAVSIFVNPLQFGPNEDFDRYPRTIEADRAGLIDVGADLLFTPAVAEMYPRPQAEQTRVEVPGLSDILCGAYRPGHFVGVATVVCKLFNMVQPDLALFGEKDFQQLLVIRRMAEDLALPVQIVGIPTVREEDGLARSSRNGYLTSEERNLAPVVYRTLTWAAAELRGGAEFAAVAGVARERLEGAGLRPDYFEVRRVTDLAVPAADDRDLVLLVAAWLGRTRLIDNLQVGLV